MPDISDPDAEPRWRMSPIATLTDDPPAMVILDGLLGFCSPQQGVCQIGYLSIPGSRDPVLAAHVPEITVIAVTAGLAKTLFRLQWDREAPPMKRLRVRLDAPAAGVKFLAQAQQPHRAKEFEEMIDLEHALNGGPVKIKDDAFSPLVDLMNGEFHSLLLTPETYSAHPLGGGDAKPLGHLAVMTAANLCCNRESGVVVLEHQVKDSEAWEPLGKWTVKGRRIFILLHNNCQKNGKKCVDQAEEETDYYLYYEALEGGPTRYEVKCNGSPTMPAFKSLHPDVRMALAEGGLIGPGTEGDGPEPIFHIESTNRTPCGGAGFGHKSKL